MEEIWKDIVGFEGRYLISNLGRCKTLVRGKNTIMKPGIEGSGYSFLHLRQGGVSYNMKLHRAVMLAFIGPDEERKFVNHKDGNKQNNRLDNLEWVTRSENDKHRYRVLGHKTPFQIKPYMKGVYGEGHPLSRRIAQYSLDGIFIREWVGMKETAKTLGISEGSILQCCKGAYKKGGGFIWKYIK